MEDGLPHVAKNLAAHLHAPSLLAGNDPAGRRDDGDAHAVENPRYLIATDIHPSAGLADAPQLRDHRLAIVVVFENDAQVGLRLIPGNLVILDVPLFLQDARNGDLYLRAGNHHLFVTSQQPVADAIQHIRNGICHHSVVNSIDSVAAQRSSLRHAAVHESFCRFVLLTMHRMTLCGAGCTAQLTNWI